VSGFYDKAVVLTISTPEVDTLPDPGNRGTDASDSPLTAKLRRAWDFISGNY
jgi:hypothetical protein